MDIPFISMIQIFSNDVYGVQWAPECFETLYISILKSVSPFWYTFLAVQAPRPRLSQYLWLVLFGSLKLLLYLL